MAFQLNTGSVRTEGVKSLLSVKEEMESNLRSLEECVEQLKGAMEGQAATAYFTEFDVIVKDIYTKLNTKVESYAEQLDSICSSFDDLDSGMSSKISVN